MFIEVAVATPSVGVVRVGDVANTNPPVPVSSVTAAAKFADDGVPKKVATFVPKLVIPVPPFDTGSMPVTLEAKSTLVIVLVSPSMVLFVKVSVVALPTNVSVAAGKVNVVVPATAVATSLVVPEVEPLNTAPVPPMIGVVNNAEVERTLLPEPVLVITPVPPLAADKVPVVPLIIGNPVHAAIFPLATVPSAGAIKACPLGRTTVPVKVGLTVGALEVSVG